MNQQSRLSGVLLRKHIVRSPSLPPIRPCLLYISLKFTSAFKTNLRNVYPAATCSGFCTSSTALYPRLAGRVRTVLPLSERPKTYKIKHLTRPKRTLDFKNGKFTERGCSTSSIRAAPAETSPIAGGFRAKLKAWAEDSANIPSATAHKYLLMHEAEQRSQVADEFAEDITPNGPINLQLPPESMASAFLNEFDRLEALSEEESDNYVRPRGSLVHRGFTSTHDTMSLLLGRSGNKWIYYSPAGDLELSDQHTDFHAVRDFATYEEIKPLLSYLSERLPADIDDPEKYRLLIPGDLGAHLRNKMKEFQREIDAEWRRYSSAFETAHKVVSHPTERKAMLLEDVASAITGKPESEISEALLFAVMRFTISEFGFQPFAPLSAIYRVVLIESQESVGALRRVQSWVRMYQEGEAFRARGGKAPEHTLEGSKLLKSFARKCRVLAHRSRDIRHYTDDGYPLTAKLGLAQHSGYRDGYIEVEDCPFTATDRDFVRCLLLAVQARGLGSFALKSLQTAIVKSTRLYDVPVFDESTAHLLLQEIGVLQVWQDKHMADRIASGTNEQLRSYLQDTETRISQGQGVEDAARLHDSMAHLRKNWGDLPVYCIDWKQTRVLDDGLSLENVPGTSDQYWLHLHISHPSAFFSADHPLGKLAAHNVASLYFVEANIPMFPDWLSNHLGIGAGKPVLTFSVKIDEAGRVLDKTIQPGIINNIQRFTFDEANKALGRATIMGRLEDMKSGGLWNLHLSGNLATPSHLPCSDDRTRRHETEDIEAEEDLHHQTNVGRPEPLLEENDRNSAQHKHTNENHQDQVAATNYLAESNENREGISERMGKVQDEERLGFADNSVTTAKHSRKPLHSTRVVDSQLNYGNTSKRRDHTAKSQQQSKEIRVPPAETIMVLKRLSQLAQAQAQHHRQSPFKIEAFNVTSVVQSPYSGLANPDIHNLPQRPRFAVNEPKMRIPFGGGSSMPYFENRLGPGHSFSYVLGELGLAVRRGAAEWAGERNIPLCYDGSVAVMDKMRSTKALQSFRESMATLNNRSNPQVVRNLVARVRSALSVDAFSSSPLENHNLGTTHLATIASPLRKYKDLINLWQVDAALREEARLERSLVGSRDDSYLPKSKSKVDKALRYERFRKKMMELYHRSHSHHWAIIAIARAFYLNEAALPDSFEAFTQPTKFAQLGCMIPELRMSAEVPDGPGEDGNLVSIDEIWRVKLVGINIFHRRLKVRMIKRLHTSKDPEHYDATTEIPIMGAPYTANNSVSLCAGAYV